MRRAMQADSGLLLVSQAASSGVSRPLLLPYGEEAQRVALQSVVVSSPRALLWRDRVISYEGGKGQENKNKERHDTGNSNFKGKKAARRRVGGKRQRREKWIRPNDKARRDRTWDQDLGERDERVRGRKGKARRLANEKAASWDFAGGRGWLCGSRSPFRQGSRGLAVARDLGESRFTETKQQRWRCRMFTGLPRQVLRQSLRVTKAALRAARDASCERRTAQGQRKALMDGHAWR